MAKVLNDNERKYRRDDLVSKLSNEIECVVQGFQTAYRIRNTKYTPEFIAELDIEVEALADIIEKLLDFQTEIDNQKHFYTIGFKKQIKATNKEEALDILKGQIDSTFDIVDLLSVEEIVEGMEVEE